LNISIKAWANELIFSSMIEACTSFISIKTCLERSFVKYHLVISTKKVYFSTGRKNNIQDGAKVILSKKKLNISTTARANELIFLSMIEACPSFKSIKTYLERPFVKYIIFFTICEIVKKIFSRINSSI